MPISEIRSISVDTERKTNPLRQALAALALSSALVACAPESRLSVPEPTPISTPKPIETPTPSKDVMFQATSYSVEYPANWIIDSRVSNSDKDILRLGNINFTWDSEIPTGGASIVVTTFTHTQNSLSDIETNFLNFSSGSWSDITIDNLKGKKFILQQSHYDYPDAPAALENVVIVLPSGSLMYYFDLKYNKGDVKTIYFQEVLDQLATSFQPKPVETPTPTPRSTSKHYV